MDDSITSTKTAGKPKTDWRAATLLVGMLLLWGVIAARLVELQWFNRLELADHVERQRTFEQSIPPRPGDILDRHGRLLATTVQAKSVFVDPSRVENPWEFARQVATAVDIDPDKLFVRLSKYRQKNFLWIKRRVDEETVQRVRDLKLPKNVINFRDEFLRQYPQGKLAVHVLGFRDIDGEGRGGVEQAFDHLIHGTAGTRQLVRDARGHVIDVQESITKAPRHGRTIMLTLDAVIQLYAEKELDRIVQKWGPKHTSAIVLDPYSGDVLAMASRPSFDPNDPVDVSPEAWKNFNIAAVYEPGSTFKPLIVAWALKLGLIETDDTLHCENGAYRMGRRLLHDHHPYGHLSLTDILVKSSNIGMAKIGERLTNAKLKEAVDAFGFGQPTGIELPGEVAGIVRAFPQWDNYSTGSIPMGQEIAVTPLQLITAHAVLANGGNLVRPQLIRQHSDSVLGQTAKLPPVRSGVSLVSRRLPVEIADWVVKTPMVEVVQRGTGRRAKLNEYDIFGKTGTAQKIDPETGRYAKDRDVCSFICGGPAHHPKLLVLIVVDEPTLGENHGGGTVAAPHAAELLKRSLLHLQVRGHDHARVTIENAR